ncbi:hypothetical protein U91I_02665 [alpha proteobacterium U9-1i]|nr:hypothetical protein U91I_02665 [alpha proteobacterium U9-1i]
MHDQDRIVGPRWRLAPKAEAFYVALMEREVTASPSALALASRLLAGAGVRVFDIVDHIVFRDASLRGELEAAGWTSGDGAVWAHEGALFPPFVRGDADVIWMRVENVEQFLAANGLEAPIEGPAHGPLRRARVFSGPTAFGVIERNGYAGFEPALIGADAIRAARVHLQSFRTRRREFDSVEQGLAHTERLVDAAVGAIGPHWSCELWLKAEREYWMGRCVAGARQKARQDAVGIGWSNIDHHTYDGSRRHFRTTVRIMQKLGYQLREMLYAGELAGWGSQVLEQPVIGSTIFADVDLAPEELTVDFSREPLPDLVKHRRAGLLSELLGESLLEAGLNHVAGRFDQRALRGQLAREGISMMAPFSDTPHLYQELTHGDRSAVDPRRVDLLEARGHISAEEAEDLRLNGAIITHLENIERNQGYKGFNREGIDAVLRKLDPRAYASGAAP